MNGGKSANDAPVTDEELERYTELGGCESVGSPEFQLTTAMMIALGWTENAMNEKEGEDK